MELDYGFFALSADVGEEGKLHVEDGDISTLLLPQFPAVVPPLKVVMKFRVPPEDSGRSHNLVLTFERPNGTRTILTEKAICAERNRFNRDWASGISVIVVCNLEVESPGVHRMHVTLDGELVKTLPLYALHQPEAQAELIGRE